MDVVEAIDAWIDERIDDLSDDELAQVLEILDAVSASDFVALEPAQLYDEDIDFLADSVGGVGHDRARTERILRSAFFGHPMPGDPMPEDPDIVFADLDFADVDFADVDFDYPDFDYPDFAQSNLDELPTETDDDELHIDLDDTASTATTDDDDELIVFLGDGQSTIIAADHASFLPDIADAEVTDGFMADLAGVAAAEQAARSAIAATPATPTAPATTARVDLRPGDILGPSFLDLSATPPAQPTASAWKRYLVPVLLVAGLAVFTFGTLQLLTTLGDDDQPVVSTSPEATQAAEPTAVSAAAAPAVTAAPVDPDAPAPTPVPDPTGPTRLAIRLVTGDVMLATLAIDGQPPAMRLAYNASNAEFGPAADVAWIGGKIGVVNVTGDAFVIDLDSANPQPTMIYEASGGLREAVQIASVGSQVAVRTRAGDITLIPSVERADPDTVSFVWDAEEEEAKATDIAAIGDLLPFVLDDGTAHVVATARDNAVEQIWSNEEQPSAYNVGTTSTDILLGAGEGAVARFRLGAVDGPLVEPVWDPFATDETQPAIGYAGVGGRTAVVLGDGTLLLTGSGRDQVIWDPTDTEIRAFAAVGDATQIVVLLETGSIVRVPLNGDLIESVWDITDETLSGAVQVVLEPSIEPAS